MRKLIIAAMLFTACSKSSVTPTEPVPTEITVTTTLYTAKSLAVSGAKSHWINIKTTYPIGSKTTLYVSFNNPYYSGTNKVRVNVSMPVFSKDTTIETNQPVSPGSTQFSNYKVDSIKGSSSFILRY